MDILLQQIKQEDIELIRSWRNSPEVAKYMYTDDEITAEQQQNWFNKIQHTNTSRYWLVEYNDQKIGLASITNISEMFSSCQWAFYIGNDQVRGSGVGFKIEYNIIEYVFNELKLNKLNCEVFSFNDGVIRMHEMFGFRREAYYRQHIKKNGKFEDVVGLGLLKSEWVNVKEKIRQKIYRN